jgi:putative ABC transport system permease protein
MAGPVTPAPKPPALAEWWLALALPPDIREAFLGDLEERFRSEILPARGLRAARRWYWLEALRAPLALPLPDRWGSSTAQPLNHSTARDALMTTLLRDLRLALRLLGRQPGFTAVVTLTLALGIGATTAIYSAVHPILVESLPYPDAGRLVMVWEHEKNGETSNVGYATFRDVADGSASFDHVAAMAYWETILTGTAEPERLFGQSVSATFFRMLGAAPALGRDFTAAEDVPEAPRAVILSHALWRARFGGDSSVVGRAIALGGFPYTVVGVMPAGFENVLSPDAQLWRPLRYDASLPQACRTCRHLRAVGRLKADVSPAAARRELAVLHARMVADHPTEYASTGFTVPTLHAQVTGGVRPALLALVAAVALVLLIACANVANLLLARGAQREGEFAVRTALGAGRGRLIRQILTESLVLAAAGGVLGVGLAIAGVRALIALAPPDLPRLEAIAVNGEVLAVALLVTTIVGVGFGLAPAWHAARTEPRAGLHQQTRHSIGGRRALRSSLVVSEVALALLLLVGSGLLFRSMQRLLGVSPGFDPDRLFTLQVQTGGPRFQTDSATWAFFERVRAAARDLPGVEAVGLTSQLPLSGEFDAYGIHLESRPVANPEEDPSAFRFGVSPGYLEAMRISVLRGRTLEESDRGDAPPVVLINQALARRAWPGEDPVGQRIRLGGVADGPWRTVVGIAGDVRHLSLSAEVPNAVYVPETQWFGADNAMSLIVRTRGDPEALIPAVRRAVRALDPDQPIVRVALMSRVVEASAAERRFTLVLFEAFGLLAVVLSAAGIYGVLAGAVAERRREIGVRTALGATQRDILGLVLRQGLTLTAAGAVIGLGAAALLTRAIDDLLFQVPRLDPVTYAGVTLLMALVAGVACWVPARRAVRVDPVAATRGE